MNVSKIISSPTLIFFVFSGVSAFIIRKMTGDSGGVGDLLGLASLVLPAICYIVSIYVIRATSIIRLISQILLLPFRLLGMGRKRDHLKEQNVSRRFGAAAIFISGLLYWIVGNFLINSRDVDFSLTVYTCVGLLWGVLLYISYQKGIVEEMESEI